MNHKPSALLTKTQRMKMYGDYVFLKNNQLIPPSTTFEVFLVKPLYLRKHKKW